MPRIAAAEASDRRSADVKAVINMIARLESGDCEIAYDVKSKSGSKNKLASRARIYAC